MSTVRDVLDALERIAPSRFAFSFDRVGLQVGSLEQEVVNAAVSLDRSLGAIQFAEDANCQLLLSHHPLFFQPLTSLVDTSYDSRVALRLARNGISFIAAHTNWDSAAGGINDALAELLNLESVRAFGSGAEVSRVRLQVMVPHSSADAVIDAASRAGAGEIGNYSRCAFQTNGMGTFEASTGANPTIGTRGSRETVEESCVEMVLRADQIRAVESAVRHVHPYEEPAITFAMLSAAPEQPAGRIGSLAVRTTVRDFSIQLRQVLGTAVLSWGDPNRLITRVAVCGGAADGEWRDAQRQGADVFVTGEVKQHISLEASESGMAIIAAGHYATEQPGVVELSRRMGEEIPSIVWKVYEPPAGFAGRPNSW